jgi:hypothetical protein
MCSININNIEAVRAFELGLLVSCPLEVDSNPYECQLHVFCLRPLRETAECLYSLSDEDCVRYYRNHIACFSQKSAMMGV